MISIPEAPAPPGAEAEWFEGDGGLRLRAVLFPRTSAVRGSVILSPGRTEPIEKYLEVVRELAERGFVVLAHDWRGQGLSQRLTPVSLKGHAEGLAAFIADYQALLARFEARLPKPWMMLGHSMGGCLDLATLAAGETRMSAAILSAPMLGIPLGPAPRPLASALAAAMTAVGRGQDYVGAGPDPLADEFETNRLTHDRTRYQRYKAQLRTCPELALGGLTWGWLAFALEATAAIAAPRALEKIAIPVCIVAAGDERIVVNAPSRAAAARLPKGRYVEIAGAWHEVLLETDDKRAVFWREFDALADGVTSPPS